MKNLWGSEPAAIIAAIEAIIGLFIAFGLNLSGEQVAAIMTVAVVILGLVTRSQVTPVAQLHDL